MLPFKAGSRRAHCLLVCVVTPWKAEWLPKCSLLRKADEEGCDKTATGAKLLSIAGAASLKILQDSPRHIQLPGGTTQSAVSAALGHSVFNSLPVGNQTLSVATCLPATARPSRLTSSSLLSPTRPRVFWSAVRPARVFQLSHIPPDHRKSANPQRTDNLTSPDTLRSNTAGRKEGQTDQDLKNVSHESHRNCFAASLSHTREKKANEGVMGVVGGQFYWTATGLGVFLSQPKLLLVAKMSLVRDEA